MDKNFSILSGQKRIRKYFVHCVLLHEAYTQFSNYFHNNYILFCRRCQQFDLFSHFAPRFFVAMHTYPEPFLYILPTCPKQQKQHILINN